MTKEDILWKVLIVDDEINWIERYKIWLKELTDAIGATTYLHPDIVTAKDGERALQALEADDEINIVIADIFMAPYCNAENIPDDRENKPFGGIWLAIEIDSKLKGRNIRVLLISGKTEAKRYVKKWLRGVPYRFVDKFSGEGDQFKNELLGKTYIAFVEMTKIYETVSGDRPLVYVSAVMKKVIETADKARVTNLPVLIQGENGVGKENIARYIHLGSQCSQNRLIPVSCTAVPDTIFEGEMFGYEKGAFTGAIRRHRGFFEQADNSTLFLDEIGEMSMGMQAKLLRAIQEKEINRLGGEEPIEVDTRIIAATNKDLSEQVKNGNFREDLYYRLNIIPIYVPRLADRKEDIPALVEYFLEKYNKENNKDFNIKLETKNAMMEYSWPGNVRELNNLIQRGATLGEEEIVLAIREEDRIKREERDLFPSTGIELPKLLEEYEIKHIKLAIKKSSGNIREAARLLGFPERTLRNKMTKFNLISDKNDLL